VEIDLHKPGTTAKVLRDIIDIDEAQTEFANAALEHTLVFECQSRGNHRSPLPAFNRLQKAVGSAQAGSERSHQHIRINHYVDHI
jgi:hypothetical protein